jgi:ribosomal protein S12 methylthiotransferase
MRPQLRESVKRHRQRELMLAQQAIVLDRHRTLLGKTIEVLIDEPSEEGGWWIGRTRGQAPDVDSVTLVRGEELHRGMFVEAQIVDVTGYDLIAQA